MSPRPPSSRLETVTLHVRLQVLQASPPLKPLSTFAQLVVKRQTTNFAVQHPKSLAAPAAPAQPPHPSEINATSAVGRERALAPHPPERPPHRLDLLGRVLPPPRRYRRRGALTELCVADVHVRYCHHEARQVLGAKLLGGAVIGRAIGLGGSVRLEVLTSTTADTHTPAHIPRNAPAAAATPLS
jgi:hypothetical protein